ncbi:MAG: hypothetical protein ACJAS4_003790 [Bacteriovoracaceae bacterium]|jgi:hypothetical protein
MTLSTSNSKKEVSSFKRIPPKKRLTGVMILSFIITILFCTGWEFYILKQGFLPALDDKEDLWSINREKVRDDSTVFIGASRQIHNLNLYKWEELTGKRPIQLSISTSNSRLILEHFANDTQFKGTLVMGLINGMYFTQTRPVQQKTLEYLNYYKQFSPGQKISFYLNYLLDSNLAFIEQIELSLPSLIKEIPIENREKMRPYFLPTPYFTALDINRNGQFPNRVLKSIEIQNKIKERALAPIINFGNVVTKLEQDKLDNYSQTLETIILDSKNHINKIQKRGGKVVILYHPSSGDLKKVADGTFKKEIFWDNSVRKFGADLLIHYLDYPQLNEINCCIDESHLTPNDSTIYTERIVEILDKNNLI